MNDADFDFIESRLAVLLPTVFKKFMRSFPNDAEHELMFDGASIIQTHAELFVIEELSRTNEGECFDYYELQPELRDRRFIRIGGDGCGNYFFMVGDDASSNDLWIWEHDPYDGFSRQHRLSLFLNRWRWRLVKRENPFASTPNDGRIVARTDHPTRSMLDPITMSEWLETVDDDPQLERDEHHHMQNPFTNESVSLRRWPGRASMSISGSNVHISYTSGRLEMLPSSEVRAAHKIKLDEIASRLNAWIY